MPDSMAARWFPFIGALFLFIWFCNLIGYLPLPTNTEEKFNLFGAHIPSFALYAATANISVPLVLALVVFVVFNCVGIRPAGPDRLPQEPDPGRRPRADAAPDLPARGDLDLHAADLADRPTVRQHPRRPHDHPVHGRRARRDPRAAVPRAGSRSRSGSLIYLFELGLVATLQAFIFATLAAIYLGGAVTHH